jgi:hypothetical protein
MLPVVRTWLPLALVITVGLGFSYLIFQQNGRLSANDPQIQLSEDWAAAYGDGLYPQLPSAKVDIAGSLAPFIIVYDDQLHPLTSNGMLHNEVPVPPSGVFAYARDHHQNRLTWQPEPGVRLAMVMTRYQKVNSGYVLVARSLREVESRADKMLKLSICFGIFSLVSTFLLVSFPSLRLREGTKG